MSDDPEDQERPDDFPTALAGALLAMFYTILLILAIVAFSGCTQQDRVASGSVHTMRQLRATPTADGGKVVLEETWTETQDQATTRTGFDPVIGDALKGAGTVIAKAATGDWTGAIAAVMGLITTVGAGYAATQRAKAQAANDLADLHATNAAKHEADATEGWAKFSALAQAKA